MHKYLPHVDGLRAIAVLLVVVFHAWPNIAPGGFVGVDVFFVISGFLITSIILEEHLAERFTFRSFYARRIRRIFPALVIVLAATWVAGSFILTYAEFRQVNWHIAAGAGFASNIVLWTEAGYFDTAAALKPLLHLWSLGIEEQYYLLWPLLLVFLGRKRWSALILAVVLGALSFAANLWLVRTDPVGGYYLPHARAWELLAGSALAAIAVRVPSLMQPAKLNWVLRGLAEIVGVAALIGLVAGTFVLSRADPFPDWRALLPVGATVLLIATGHQSIVTRFLLSNRVMVGIGLISYALYLWHWPILAFARIELGTEPGPWTKFWLVSAAFALATATFFVVERPVRFGWIPKHVSTALAAVLITVVGGGAGFVAWANMLPEHMVQIAVDPSVPNEPVMTSRQVHDAVAEANKPQHAYQIRDCSEVGLYDDQSVAEFCRVWNSARLTRIYVLWGDSHAHAWAPLVAQVAEAQGARLVEFSHAGCPPIPGLHRTIDGGPGARCNTDEMASGILAAIGSLNADRIIVAARWSLYTRGLVANGQVVENTYVTNGNDQATSVSSAVALQAQLPLLFDKLSVLAPTTAVLTMPRLLQPIEQGIERDPSGYQPTMQQHQDWESITTPIFQEIAKTNPRVRLFDPADLTCKVGGKCSSFSEGVPLYSDDNHLTEAGSMIFRDRMAAMLAEDDGQR
jgi:peptidoglycan/LPS O-acetylase OafA/YrhL